MRQLLQQPSFGQPASVLVELVELLAAVPLACPRSEAGEAGTADAHPSRKRAMDTLTQAVAIVLNREQASERPGDLDGLQPNTYKESCLPGLTSFLSETRVWGLSSQP